MSLASVISGGVATIKGVLSRGDVLEDITLERWTGYDSSGDETFATAETYSVFVELGAGHVWDEMNQTQIPTIAKVIVLEPLTDNGADDRTEPLDPRDKITLPGGASGPIAKFAGVVDGSTGSPYMFEIWVGK